MAPEGKSKLHTCANHAHCWCDVDCLHSCRVEQVVVGRGCDREGVVNIGVT